MSDVYIAVFKVSVDSQVNSSQVYASIVFREFQWKEVVPFIGITFGNIQIYYTLVHIVYP